LVKRFRGVERSTKPFQSAWRVGDRGDRAQQKVRAQQKDEFLAAVEGMKLVTARRDEADPEGGSGAE
jgi:hypothetical protein